MMGFWGDAKKIEILVLEFCEEVEKCLKTSFNAMEVYIEKGETEKVIELSTTSHNAETNADKIRRKIIKYLLEGSLLPNTRADFMNLLEYIDDIADDAESLLDSFILPSLDLKEVDKEQIKEIMVKLSKQYELLKEGIAILFSDTNQAIEKVGMLEKLEKEIDEIEEKLIRKIGSRQDISIAEKLVYREFISKIADIGDVIENTGDQLEIMIAVRKG